MTVHLQADGHVTLEMLVDGNLEQRAFTRRWVHEPPRVFMELVPILKSGEELKLVGQEMQIIASQT